MEKLSKAFLSHSASVLGETRSGLTGSIIIAFCNAWAADRDIDTPHTRYPFEAANKRTALLDNLLTFPPSIQARMLLDLCDMAPGADNDKVAEIKQKLAAFLEDNSSRREVPGIPDTSSILKDPYVLNFMGIAGAATLSHHKPNADRNILTIFLCHAKEDKPAARHLYNLLKKDHYSPWLDEEDLLPGQEWNIEIPKAVRNADVVLILLSSNSVTKHGYIQREIKVAIDAAEEYPEGSTYIIPARLEECSVPNQLSKWQWVDTFAPNGYSRLCRALDAKLA
jgi:hypothetical protein